MRIGAHKRCNFSGSGTRRDLLGEIEFRGGDMRSVRFGLVLFFLLPGVSGWAKQSATSPQTSSIQAASDPQAVAVVQAAITALGGATAIGQAQSWTFQGSLSGPTANGNVSYTVSTAIDTTSYIPLRNGLKKPLLRIRS